MRLFVGPCSARPVTPQLSCLHPQESACPRQAEGKIRFPGHTTRPTRRPQLSLRERGSTAKGTQKQIHKPGLGAERAGFVCVCLFPPPIRSKGRREMFPSSLLQAPKTETRESGLGKNPYPVPASAVFPRALQAPERARRPSGVSLLPGDRRGGGGKHLSLHAVRRGLGPDPFASRPPPKCRRFAGCEVLSCGCCRQGSPREG